MLIGLHDAEREHMPGKTFPNLALMKLSAWHKVRGDTVEWWEPYYQDYDRVYSSKVFDFTPENPYLPPDAILGGTGYDVHSMLPQEIDDFYPDYSIYPDCDYAIGYTTRGCIYDCEWCGVREKEGYIAPYRTWREIVRSDSDKLVLMDNNILACEHGVEQLRGLVGSGYRLDCNQGLDARLVTSEIAELLASIDWIRFIRFSCDTVERLPYVERSVKLLEQVGVKPYRIFIYLLVRRNITDAIVRLEALRRLGAVTVFAQAERNERRGIVPTAEQLDFAQRYVYSGAWRTRSWAEFRTAGKRKKEEVLV